MPTTTIPIIARTNTIDEWRIQTNKSASDLNDLGFGTYDKDRGTLLLSNTSILSITAEGTPLQVANNVLFQNNLTLSNNLFLGVESSGTGNLIVGNSLTVEGFGKALSVSNNAYVGIDLEVVNSIYTDNVYANNDMTIGDDVIVGGVVSITSSGAVLSIPDGEASINLVTSETIVSDNVRTDNLYAAFARIDVLDDLAFARIGILENTTGNSYYLSSNSHNSNTITTRYITANISGNIVNFSSNVASINTATILDANIVTQISETLTVNVSSTNTATILDGNVVTLISEDTTINVATINVSSTNDATVLIGNVVTLTSNDSTLNVATVNTANITWLTSSNTIYANNIITNNVEVSTINAAYINVSSDVWLQEGAQLRIYADTIEDEVFIVDGKSMLQTTYVRGNIAVEGTWTALGNVEYEVSEFTLNARTPTNADASIRNNRVVGDDAFIRWDETDDQWKVSKGNTYSDLFGILDASFLDATVTSNSTANVATPSAVKAAFETAQFAGGYANNAYVHANNSYIHANNSYIHANAAYNNSNVGYEHANAAFDWANVVSATANANTARLTTNNVITASYANSAYVHANISFHSQNTSGIYANAAFDTANTALVAGGQIAGGYANSAYETANTGVVNAEIADTKAAEADLHARAAFDAANTAQVAGGVISGAYANSAYEHANASFDTANNKLNNTGPDTFTGTLTVTGPVNSQWIKHYTNGEALLQSSKIVLNANQNQNQGPSLNGTIEVDRGTAANSVIRYNESIDKWEYTHDGVNYTTLGFVSTRANNITGPVTGGATNRIPYQTTTDTTSFIPAPSAANYFLKWTGSTFDWAAVPVPDLSTVSFRADQITSGTFAAARLSGTYNINITGSAGSAATATSATTAGSATTATNATNVTSGGNVNTNSILNYGPQDNFGAIHARSGGVASSRYDSRAALRVTGDIAVSNDVWAINFRGTATSALYADLAEKYLSDKKYPVGTIMMIGGKKEVTAAKNTKKHAVIGIVSEKPAYIMNSDLKNGLIIGLKGRLPIRLIGTCEKGDLITISDQSGVGVSVKDNVILPFRIVSLENKTTEQEGLVEVVIM
jgi:hypothetical protein